MLRKLRTRITFANVVSMIALFVALGGTSYAAVTLKKNSVRSTHIKDGQVTTKDVKNASLLAQDFAAGQIPPGPQGERGQQGEPGQQGERGPQGPGASKIVHRSGAPDVRLPPVEIARVGPWTVESLCYGSGDSFKQYVYVRGPGGAQWRGETSVNDSQAVTPFRGGAELGGTGHHAVRGWVSALNGEYARLAAEIQLHSADETATVSVNGLADNRDGGNEHCTLYGTAVPAS